MKSFLCILVVIGIASCKSFLEEEEDKVARELQQLQLIQERSNLVGVGEFQTRLQEMKDEGQGCPSGYTRKNIQFSNRASYPVSIGGSQSKNMLTGGDVQDLPFISASGSPIMKAKFFIELPANTKVRGMCVCCFGSAQMTYRACSSADQCTSNNYRVETDMTIQSTAFNGACVNPGSWKSATRLSFTIGETPATTACKDIYVEACVPK